MMLSDIDVAQLKAELEKDLAARVNQQEDSSDVHPNLSDELNSLRESLHVDNDYDGDDQLPHSFSLLADARESICSMRQASSELVQNINDELLESRNDAASNNHHIQGDKAEHNVQEEKEDSIFSLTQIPSTTTNNDVVDQSESDSSTNCERYDCDSDAATNDCCETDAAAEYHDQYLDQTSLVAGESFEQAMIEANDQLRMIEEKHRMKRLILEQRKEHIRRNRNAKRLQKWYQRINTRRLLIASFVSSLTSNTVQSAVEVGLSQCLDDVLESTVDCSNRPIILRSSRVLSIPQTRQMINWNDLNCRHIIVVRDPTSYEVHIFVLYRRHLKHYIVHLTRRLTNGVLTDTFGALLLSNRLYDLIPRQDDSEKFTRQALVGSQPLLVANLSPPRMLENCSTLNRLTPLCLCLVLCKISQRIITRRALRALQCLKAAVRIQSIYRGFIVRRRLGSIQCSTFDYIDNELDNILGDNSNDIPQFDEEELGEEEVSWNPCKPYIEPTVNCSIDETDMISSTGEADTIPKLESEPLHRVVSSASRVQHDIESEDTISRRKATPKIVRRDNLKERKAEEPNILTWQNMKVKDIRVAQVRKSYVCASFVHA